MLKTIHDPTLQKIQNIQHAFFTRHGGVSTGYYASLNCSYAGHDEPKHIEENRRRAMLHLGYRPEQLMSVKNVHGCEVKFVDESWLAYSKPETEIADAMVTTQTGILLGSDSADCPIVLLADEEAKVVGLAHAGWRSARLGVIENTLQAMMALGANLKDLSAVIGPCITQDSYEIDLKFYLQFLDDNKENKCYFKPALRADHFFFDLKNYVYNRLSAFHLKSVTAIDLDTYRNEEYFFSCRRAYHQGDLDFGGHLSCIGLK